MLAEKRKLVFLFAMAVQTGLVTGLSGKGRIKMRFGVMYLMTTEAIHSGLEMFASMRIISFRFTEMALTAYIECFDCRQLRRPGDIVNGWLINVIFEINMA